NSQESCPSRCPNFQLLCELFEKNLATGRFAAASTQALHSDDDDDEDDQLDFEATLASHPSLCTTRDKIYTAPSLSSSSAASMPLRSNSAVLNKSVSSSSSSTITASPQLKKHVAAYGLNSGEHPKRSHTIKDASFASLELNDH
ncbi:UNVERIFIED_CONTAM: hypothetical protein HDU68_004596, partial [Siphonaria sp. JEL0065]